MLEGDEVCTLRDLAFDLPADAQYVAHQPVMEVRPAVDDRLNRPVAKRRQQDDAQHVDQGAGIEEQSEQDRTERRHQMSSQTATRRSRYLLYSPNRVMNPGSLRTASGTTWKSVPSSR